MKLITSDVIRTQINKIPLPADSTSIIPNLRQFLCFGMGVSSYAVIYANQNKYACIKCADKVKNLNEWLKTVRASQKGHKYNAKLIVFGTFNNTNKLVYVGVRRCRHKVLQQLKPKPSLTM